MDDLKNKELFKLLWLPEKEEIIRLMKDETLASSVQRCIILNYLNKYIDVSTWHKKYSVLYHKWLDADIEEIYDLSASVNTQMINAIKKVNYDLSKESLLLFYWFDVDRSISEDWKWEKDPLTHKKLILLDDSYNSLNRKISLENFIVLPN